MANSFQIETQEQRNWCWAAVAATVANYFFPGQAIEQCAVATGVQYAQGVPNTNCCPNGSTSVCDIPEALEDALNTVNNLLGKSLTHHASDTYLDFKIIRQKIDAGLPICARIRWYGEGERGHFVMIIGYSESPSAGQWVDIADPRYEDSTIPYEQFRSAYWGAGWWDDTYLVDQP
ncbi:MAG: C39 family peptidase [Bryobacteraceae bacterium]